MSDTDKDKPYWVTAEWWEPAHWRCPNVVHLRWHEGRRDRECDLPERPVRRRRVISGWRHPELLTCTWEAVYQRRPFSSPPKWFRDHRWNNPVRVKVRDGARRAVAEYRATGQVDVELDVRQHRHGARWDWE